MSLRVERDVTMGQHELMRRSTLYWAHSYVRLFGRHIRVSPEYLALEEIHSWEDVQA